MRPANERKCYSVTLSFIGWESTKNNPCRSVFHQAIYCYSGHMSSIFITDTIKGNDRIKHSLIEDIGTNHEGVLTNWDWGKMAYGCHFAGKISEWIFLSENSCIWIQIPMRFVPEGPINVYARIGSHNGLPLNRWQAIIWTSVGLVYWWIYASLSLMTISHSTQNPEPLSVYTLWAIVV